MVRKRVVVAGTFDLLHPGHVFLISEAAKMGEVIVVVARDSNVCRVKGHLPVIPEGQRLYMVRALRGVSEAILGYEGDDIFRIIEELNPDILLLGPDQKVTDEEVQNELLRRNLKTKVKRLRKMFHEQPLCSTSAIIRKVRSAHECEP